MLTMTLTTLVLSAGGGDAGVTQGTMRAMFSAISGLEQYVAHPELVRDPAQAAALSGRLETLAQLKHAFPKRSTAQEPATAVLSTLFSRYAEDTAKKFKQGEVAAVPARVRTLVSLCFTCHSRERVATDVDDRQQRVEAMSLTPTDRAQFFAATRQFDKALQVYGELFAAAPTDEAMVLEVSRGARDALALSVRVKDDPTATLALLDLIAARRDLPAFMRQSVEAWRRDVTSWRAEKFDASKASAEQLFTRAQALVTAAHGSSSFFPDETTDVLFLRASGYLNMAMGKSPDFAKRGEAVYLMGVCAGALRSALLWDVDTLFFEACVRENPHTPLAGRCFRQLSQRVYFGFTGSAGVNVPPDELQRLATLRALAE